MEDKIALVTGANKGIGYEICRQLLDKGMTVILTSRDKEKGLQAVENLQADEGKLVYQQLDLENDDTFYSVRDFIDEKYGRLDILINNAGINLENSADADKEVSALDPDYKNIMKMFEVNTLSTIKLTNILLPLLENSKDARIINISSSMAQLEYMGKGSLGYRLSKTGLNVMTRVFARELEHTNIKINSVSPGWVQTDMGGSHARLTVEEAVEPIIWTALTDDPEMSGKFMKDRNVIEW